MRLVVTSDTHFPFKPELVPDGDIFLHCGDLMYDGQGHEWNPVLESLAALPHKYKILVPGNHDYYIAHYEGLAASQLRRQAGVKLVRPHDACVDLPNGMTILTIPYVTGLPGWAYNVGEDWLLDWLNAQYREADIIAAHAPMYKILDAIDPAGDTAASRNHVGSWAQSRWYHQLMTKPEYYFNGHIHESYGEHHEWGTSFYNVAMCDRNYEQNNPCVVIDLED